MVSNYFNNFNDFSKEPSMVYSFSFKETSRMISALSPNDNLQMRHFPLKCFQLRKIIYPSRGPSSLTPTHGKERAFITKLYFLHFKEIPPGKLALQNLYLQQREEMSLF